MRLYKLIIILSFFAKPHTSSAQADWEHTMLSGINPRYPSSDVWKTFTNTAKPLSVAAPAAMFAVGLIEKNKSLQYNALEAFGSLAIAAGATEILKATVKRQRPYLRYTDIYPNEIDNSYSFPSGHVSVAFSTAVSVSLTAKKWYITAPALAWATGVAYSRMYEGQHYPSDVFVGAAVGAGSAFLSHWLRARFFEKAKTKKPSAI